MTTRHKHTHTRQSIHSTNTRSAARPAFFNLANLAVASRLSVQVLAALVILVLGFAGWRVSARRATASPDSGQTHKEQNGLGGALNPDGSLRAGVQGSFDAREFHMEYGPNGAPRFVSAAPPATCNGWDTQFNTPGGVNGVVSAVAISGTSVYVGGSFTIASNVVANNVAKFDTLTNTWSALGTGGGNGVNSGVAALAVSGNAVYVGGFFTTANVGGTTIIVNRVAKYDLTTGIWSGIGGGTGVDGDVKALGVSGNLLYIGGDFSIANIGGTIISVNNVAKVDLATGVWSRLGTGTGNGVDGVVNALAFSGNALYAGGSFSAANIGGTIVNANKVAKFDILTQTWSALGTGGGNGLDATAFALAVSGGDLYVGGPFTAANVGGPAVNVNKVAKFDTLTNTWSKLGNDVGGITSGVVFFSGV